MSSSQGTYGSISRGRVLNDGHNLVDTRGIDDLRYIGARHETLSVKGVNDDCQQTPSAMSTSSRPSAYEHERIV
jgi:hypothetical protein